MSTLPQIPPNDPIIAWHCHALEAIQSAGSNGKPGVPPTTGTRLMAMLSTALEASRDSGEAAAHKAAHTILWHELPTERVALDNHYYRAMQSVRGPWRDIVLSRRRGQGIADSIRRIRNEDGSDDTTTYRPPVNALPGYTWMPAETGPTAGVALGPNWGTVQLWNPKNTALRPDGLQARPDVNLDLYAQQLNEVRLYGGLANTATTTSLRSAEQTDIALFWAYDRPDTFRPYGQLVEMAMDVAAQQKMSSRLTSELLATLNRTMADGVTKAWKAKYDNIQPRPWDLITGSFSDTDGSAITVRDPNWQSLLSSINGVQSPPFPDYLSGHSVMGGVWASVMTHFLGDNVTFSAKSVDLPGKIRHFDGRIPVGSLGDISAVMASPLWRNNAFFESGLENAISRVYGGVHIREACTDSFLLGVQIGANL
jgi:hypothetical protein